MAKLTTAEFIEAIKELSVLELNDLVKADVKKNLVYPQSRSLYHRGYHRDSAVYGLLDGKKIGLSLAHSLMGGMRCLHSSGHGIRTERGLYHGCPLGVHHSGLYRIYHQKL